MSPPTINKSTRPRKLAPRNVRKRRGIGRPASGTQGVGREALIASTVEMLRKLPPNKITRAEVARYMRVDPSLIRYYFKNRSALLLAAAEKVTSEFQLILEEETARSDMTPEGRLLARVWAMLRLETTYPFFHRLLLEEIAPLESPAALRFTTALTQRAVAGYQTVVDAGAKDGTLRQVDSALLFLSVIGLSECLVAAMPILRLALGKDIDEKTIIARYREFLRDLLLRGLRA